MKDEIKIKEVIICTLVLIVIIVLFEIFIQPYIEIRTDYFSKVMQKITASQNISPQRLYINVWRTAKNSYVDSTMNEQNWNRWRNRYLKQIKTVDDADVAINTMLASLNDSYTKYLCSDLFSKQKIILDSKITGVGVMFNKAGEDVVINHVLDNSPAQAANIKPGDTIISINGKEADADELETLISNIEDSKSDTVELVIKRDNNIIKTTLRKKEIPIKTMEYKITPDNIGIITLSNIMGEKAIEDFKEILEKTNDTRALIIDLRNNYGGILANAIVMVNYMMDVDEIVSIESRINAEYKIYSAGERIFKQKPVIILINKKTASAAEIFAGVLRKYADAVLIGENSFGKNSIQQVIPLHNSSGLIITTDKYILPDGNDIYGVGLTPDIYLRSKNVKKDNQIEIALKLLRDILDNE